MEFDPIPSLAHGNPAQAVAFLIGLFLFPYLLGAIPFGWILAKLTKGIDLRQFGSGNIGATNAGRAIGKWAAIVVYLLDFAKGYFPVWLIGKWGELAPGENGLRVFVGSCAILGHCFPVYLRFRGGKGVATTTGVMLALAPIPMLLAGVVWGLTALVTRYVSVASLALAISLPILVWAEDPQAATGPRLPVLAFAGAIALFIVWTHRENIRRLAAGSETKMGKKKES